MKFEGGLVYGSPVEWKDIHTRYPGFTRVRMHDDEHMAFEFEERTVVLDKNLVEYVEPTKVDLQPVVVGDTTYLVKFENKDVQHPQSFEFLCTGSKIVSDLSNISETLPQMWLADEYIVVRDGVLDVSKFRYTFTPNGSDYIDTIKLGPGVHVLHEPKYISYDVEPQKKILPIEGKAFFLENNDEGHLAGAEYDEETDRYTKVIDMSHTITITVV